MDTLVIGCRTTENELLAAMEACSLRYDISWIEAGLHNVKKKLNQTLQERIDASPDYGRILFATGFCGNAVCGLTAGKAELVFPRVDDCVSFLFGSCRKKLLWNDSYFLTEGWLKGETNIWREYRRSLEKYGEAKTRQIFQVLFAHYRRIALLDTGCYDLDGTLPGAKQIADAFSLDLKVLPVSPDYFRALLTGPWDPARFLVVRPGETVTGQDLAVTY